LPPHPWRSFNALNGRVFPSLRGFMLHAPLAKLLAKGKGRKLPPALNAICHQSYKTTAKTHSQRI
jgi:hypothetical protein